VLKMMWCLVVTAAVAETETAGSYDELLARIEARRMVIAQRCRMAGDAGLKERIVEEAGQVLESVLVRDIWPRWLGTPWDFNGISERPGEGEIACGYFVTTCLRDAGFELSRYELARLPSETMIARLVGKERVRRFSNVSMEVFLSRLLASGDGVYLVGLDCHTGFLLVRNGKVEFCHSSYVGSSCVTIEPAGQSAPLVTSRLRVVGRITPDAELVRAWLEKRRVGCTPGAGPAQIEGY
jgi:hypothetical protein